MARDDALGEAASFAFALPSVRNRPCPCFDSLQPQR
jgi:hypothetical protein